MKLPRGFGKNYFSLNAITATVNSITMHESATRVQHFHLHASSFAQEDETIEELEEVEAAPWFELLNANKACHCNYVFTSTTRKILALLVQAKRFPDFYKTLNSDISPPYF